MTMLSARSGQQLQPISMKNQVNDDCRQEDEQQPRLRQPLHRRVLSVSFGGGSSNSYKRNKNRWNPASQSKQDVVTTEVAAAEQSCTCHGSSASMFTCTRCVRPTGKKHGSPNKLYVTKTSIVQHRHSSFTTTSNLSSLPSLQQKHGFESSHAAGALSKSLTALTRQEESIECIFSTVSFQENSCNRASLRKPQAPAAVTPYTDPPSVDGTGHWELHSYPSSDSEDNDIDREQTPVTQNNNNQMIEKPTTPTTRFGSFFYVASCFGRGPANQMIYEEDDSNSIPKTPSSSSSSKSSRTQMAKLTTSVHVADIISEHARDYSTFMKAYDDLLLRSHQLEEEREKQRQQKTSLTSKEALTPTHSSAVPQHPLHVRTASSISRAEASSSQYSSSSTIPPHPSMWPQYPLALCATPNSGMNILGVRYSSSSTYLPEPWYSTLPNNIKGSVHLEGIKNFSSASQLLPINSGLEPTGKSLVIDFETDLFIGTLLVRVKNVFQVVKKDVHSKHTDSSDYFGSMNRKYQAVVRGEFKSSIPIMDTVTGQVFPSPVLNLPSKWVLKSAVSIISLFAPQLQANFDGGALQDVKGPSFLSPLGSTPQVVMVQEPGKEMLSSAIGKDGRMFVHRRHANQSIELRMEEPMHEQHTLVGQHNLQKNGKFDSSGNGSTSSQSQQRAGARKKLFDKLYAKSDTSVSFVPGKIYTFEFLQHLLNFDTFSLDLGMGGKMDLCHTLSGQPLRAMGACLRMNNNEGGEMDKNDKPKAELQYIWSFDIWHQGLYKDSTLNSNERMTTCTSGAAAKKHRSKSSIF